LLQFVLAALLSAIVGASALAGSPDQGPAPGLLETLEEVYIATLRQAVGAPGRAELGGQATVRLQSDLTIVPKDPASRLLAVLRRDVPSDFVCVLLGAEGMDAPGLVRFVPAGFVDADEALHWTPDDMLASLNDTVEHGNAARIKAGVDAREARHWIVPPRYDPERHQLSWAALVIPKSAPRGSDGEITYHAVGFGRDGYVEVSIVTSVQKADQIGRMADMFLSGLNFLPGKGYGDVQPSDRRSQSGLAGAMGLDSLHQMEVDVDFWASDMVVPVAGGTVAAIGSLALAISIYRHMRRLRRRV
jgi:uncharacterized membrane-anchored protein